METEGILVKTESTYHLVVNDKIIASMGDLDGKLQKLSLKNCEDVANGYDLVELFDEVDESIDYQEFDFSSFKLGFKKALEILGNKKFSEDDMRRAFIQGVYTKAEIHRKKEEYIQSLQQTEWDCTFNPDEKDADGCLILKSK